MFASLTPSRGRPTWVLQCGWVPPLPDVTKLVCLTDLKGGSADPTLAVVARKKCWRGNGLNRLKLHKLEN